MRTCDCKKADRIQLLKASGESSPGEDLFYETHVSRCCECAREMKALSSLPSLEEIDISQDALEIIKNASRTALERRQNPATVRRLLLKPALTVVAAAAAVFLLLGIPRERTDDFRYSAEVEYDLLDERLISAENSIHALKIELFSDAGGFY